LDYKLNDVALIERRRACHGRIFALGDDPLDALNVVIVPVRDERKANRITRVDADLFKVT
jgi:hypothetical protein